MDRLDKLSNYFKEKERKKLNESYDKYNLPTMSLQEIRLSCLENNGYETPELNDKLYLHYRGFKKIENLEQYVNCKAIWLDSNGFELIENISHLINLKCLYLSNNLINHITGLDNLDSLILLDLSNNRINKIENLGHCKFLQTLNISKNQLLNNESIIELRQCESLINLDLSNNKLESDEEIIHTLSNISSLVNLSINGNELTKISSFRKKMIYHIPKLVYLDRPIDEIERIGANAFMTGGHEAEVAAKNEYRELKNKQRLKEMEDFRIWQKERSLQRVQLRENSNSNSTPYITTYIETEDLPEPPDASAETILPPAPPTIENSAIIDKIITAEVPPDTVITNAEIDNSNSNVIENAIEIDDIDESIKIVSASDDFDIANEEKLSLNEELNDDLLNRDNIVDDPNIEQLDEEIRKQIIEESLRLMKDQEHNKFNSNLWSDTTNQSEKLDETIYWSETMDLTLAKSIRENKFDFEDVSKSMISEADSGRFGLRIKSLSSLFTTALCRDRWNILDANRWSQLPANITQDNLQINYKSYYPPKIPGKHEGYQPTFEELAIASQSIYPSYLKVPKNLPSISNFDDDDENDDEIVKPITLAIKGGCYVTVNKEFEELD